MKAFCLLVILVNLSWSSANKAPANKGCDPKDLACKKKAVLDQMDKFDDFEVQYEEVQRCSCADVKKYNKKAKDGLYTLKSKDGIVYQTYCDMTTHGGGWTLVASIHENNIDGKCTTGDRWSSQQGHCPNYKAGDGNWANCNTFGAAQAATCDDYKNPGYYDIIAQNVAVWHVPNNTPYPAWKDKSCIRYHTENNFLASEGGNLHGLFKKYPLEQGIADCKTGNGPDAPIVYDHGDNHKVTELYSPLGKAEFIPGFVQFRVMNTEKAALAMCSGVKVTGCNSEHHCIGGGGYFPEGSPRQCGDFTGLDWDGLGQRIWWSSSREMLSCAVLVWTR